MKADRAKLLEELLIELQEETVKELLKRAKSGEITSAEAGQVVQLCKLNDVNINITEGDITDETKDSLKKTLAGEAYIPFVPKEVAKSA